MRNALTATLSLVAVSILTNSAQAASFSYHLNCVIDGPTNTAPGNTCQDSAFNYGTVTFTDTAPGEVNVDLNLASNYKILDFVWNTNTPPFGFQNLGAVSSFSKNTDLNDSLESTYTAHTIFNTDSFSIPPYTGNFDGQAGPTSGKGNISSLNANRINFNILDTFSTGINASSFAVKDTLNQLFAAVHIGNYDGAFDNKGATSIKVGAKEKFVEPPKTTPEPGLVLGFVGLAGLAINHKRKQAAKA